VIRPIAVLGLGGIGGLLAVRTGALCVGTERSVAAIRERGLMLVQGDQTLVRHPEATTRLEMPVSLLVVAVKAYDLPTALARVDAGALDGAVILPLQNGLEHVATLRAWARDACNRLLQAPPVVAAGSVGRVSASSPEPGVVVQTTLKDATIRAASQELPAAELAERLVPLDAPGIELTVVDDEGEVLWEKAARLAVLAAATVATGLPVGPLRADPAWRPRLEAALAEACSVAAADGVPLDAREQWAIIMSLPHDLDTSAARDAAQGGPTELDAIAGAVVRAGVRLGVGTPVLTEVLQEAACRAR
jgi:2-dehydropantoate 2-reductase